MNAHTLTWNSLTLESAVWVILVALMTCIVLCEGVCLRLPQRLTYCARQGLDSVNVIPLLPRFQLEKPEYTQNLSSIYYTTHKHKTFIVWWNSGGKFTKTWLQYGPLLWDFFWCVIPTPIE